MVMKMNGSLHQELKIEENFKDTSTSFLAFQLLPEVSQQGLWAQHARGPGPIAHTVPCVSGGAAVGGLCRTQRGLHLEPEGPGPAPAEGAPQGLL